MKLVCVIKFKITCRGGNVICIDTYLINQQMRVNQTIYFVSKLINNQLYFCTLESIDILIL